MKSATEKLFRNFRPKSSEPESTVDRTIMNLLSFIIGGGGLFVVLTKFNVPELNMMFFGENPFAIKRDTIDTVMTWMFTVVTLIGILLQIYSEILGEGLPSRQHSSRFYAYFSLGSLVAIAVVILILTGIGERIAKRIWLPEIVAKMTDSYRSAQFIIEHDGWREDQLSVKESTPNPTMYREANFQTAKERITQIEKLLDLPADNRELEVRLDRLKPYFGF
jgi:hypothetical protein